MSNSDSTASSPVLGVVLAGGASRRMGGTDKTLLPWMGHTLLEAVVARARPQVNQLAVSGNLPPELVAKLEIPVVEDKIFGPGGAKLGPLAGIVSILRSMGDQYPWLATFAADSPFLPMDYVTRCLHTAANSGRSVICAASSGRVHYTFALWRTELLPRLESALESRHLALRDLAAACGSATETFIGANPDPFFNINTPDDWETAKRYLARAEE